MEAQETDISMEMGPEPLGVAPVIQENDFVEKRRWASIDDAPDGAQEGGPRLVHEADDDGRLG